MGPPDGKSDALDRGLDLNSILGRVPDGSYNAGLVWYFCD